VQPEEIVFAERQDARLDRTGDKRPVEPFGAGEDPFDWWPDLFDDMPIEEEALHGNHA
jgi:hypothetical protein